MNQRDARVSSYTGHAAAADSAAALAERRREPRTAAHELTEVRVIGADGAPAAPVATCIVDISREGLALIHAAPIDEGTRFLLEPWPSPDNLAPTADLYVVIRCTQMMGGRYLIGAELRQRGVQTAS